MPKKIKELKKLLRNAGFDYRQGKGSHTVWFHPDWSGRIVIAKRDGEDSPLYLEREVKLALEEILGKR